MRESTTPTSSSAIDADEHDELTAAAADEETTTTPELGAEVEAELEAKGIGATGARAVCAGASCAAGAAAADGNGDGDGDGEEQLGAGGREPSGSYGEPGRKTDATHSTRHASSASSDSRPASRTPSSFRAGGNRNLPICVSESINALFRHKPNKDTF